MITFGAEHPGQLLQDLSQLQPFLPLRLLLTRKTIALITSTAITAIISSS
jgi:hypothetical protein